MFLALDTVGRGLLISVSRFPLGDVCVWMTEIRNDTPSGRMAGDFRVVDVVYDRLEGLPN